MITDKFENLEDIRVSKFRMVVVWTVVLLCMFFLVFRLFWIQVLHPEFLIKEGNSRTERNYIYEPARGLITDRFGKILAISNPVKTVRADPQVLYQNQVTTNVDLIKNLALVLELTPKDLYNLIKDPKKRDVRLKRYLPLKNAEVLAGLNIPGIRIYDSYERVYPAGASCAALIGILNGEGNGVYGIEQSFNEYLVSTPSKRKTLKDHNGHIIENLGVVKEGKAGGNLMLSIDSRLQSFAYELVSQTLDKYKADQGYLVLLDVKTGEILAMVNAPSFDPNNRAVFNDKYAQNKTISDVFEPGSTLKPFVALSALENKVTTWNEVFNTRPFVVDGKTIRDSHYMDYGTLKDILRYSSNTGMAQISMREGQEKILDTLLSFGFGKSTQSGLIGESSGVLHADRAFWADIDRATLGYGYGVSVTCLQLAHAYATLANLGRATPISILRQHNAVTPTQVGSVDEIKRIHVALESVISSGTGGKAAIGRYRIAGKTGTAQLAEAGSYGKLHISTFAGFAPLTNPRFALVVVFRAPREQSYYGGTVSAPIFREVMTRALQLYNIAPDR